MSVSHERFDENFGESFEKKETMSKLIVEMAKMMTWAMEGVNSGYVFHTFLQRLDHTQCLMG